ncbi:MAG: AbrB/MazE/SpoVT family DNA-binding domain-containing protein [bacterium]|nr:AbrB/MazE/SpoVT family DNA-binding domain-containing protein [bacterium]
MEAKVDSAGRIMLPKSLREALGLAAGSVVDVSAYGRAIQITPGGRTATLEREPGGRLVAVSDTPVSDEVTSALIDSARR